VHTVVPTVGALLSGAPEYAYLQRSIAAFPSADEFVRKMERAGLSVIECAPLTFGVCHLYLAQPRERV
jgi:demethylmenaquinone methyltransferase/2-methoxy-6-polyprenyl-1,4-benzoquinol methylase